MVLDWEPMVLEYVPEAKMAVTMAKLASERAKGVSPQEKALRQCEGRIQKYWDLMRPHSSIEDGVEYRAYEQMHLRISKSLSNSFKAQQALEISREAALNEDPDIEATESAYIQGARPAPRR